MLRDNKILCTNSGLNAQHGRHAHKCSKIFFSRINGSIFTKLLYMGLQPIIICSNDGLRMTMTNFTARSVLET